MTADDNKKATNAMGSVVKTFNVLEALSNYQSCELTYIVKKTGYPKSTVHRILLTLIELGYVKQFSETNKYGCTFRILNLGSKIVGKNTIVLAAKAILEEMETITNENINLCLPDGNVLVIVSKRESNYSLRPSQPIGQRLPFHDSANGRAYLAHCNQEMRRGIIERLYNDGSISDILSFEDRLANIRREGVALEIEEHIKGVGCIASPLFDHTGRAIGTLGIATPTVRLKEEKISQFRSLVITKARELSNQLGAELS
ncbi:IclR family transcriptional regulator [Polycladidibacter stylochi]|uniref:IclR family transcriptional regulator n=1 Tax=Polycladidibacter stylochi TaxID=1807766 RepID=UPI0008315CE5|nr:IclR family transcriptional regulator [Pseudovibrio stylochi]